MSVGFIHGVMNTDNCSIIGDTIDYGPCAFIDIFKKDAVFSSIDTFGRYSYKNQPLIGQWNLVQLANCLLPLFSVNKEKSIQMAQEEIDKFPRIYEEFWFNEMREKLGLKIIKKQDMNLIKELEDIMESEQLDFTITFSSLKFIFQNKTNRLVKFNKRSKKFNNWILKWKSRLAEEKITKTEIIKKMEFSNPYIIPRNHLVEEAIDFANKNDFLNFSKLFNLLSKPYSFEKENHRYHIPPDKVDENFKTFCGT